MKKAKTSQEKLVFQGFWLLPEVRELEIFM